MYMYLLQNWNYLSTFISIINMLIVSGPFIIVLAELTGFHSRQSTFSQAGWLLVWFPINLFAMGLGDIAVKAYMYIVY